MKAIHYMGVPGDVAPKTTGALLASVVMDVLKENDIHGKLW
ncbi:hypothetical protein [Virgibacillus kimchii]